MKRPFVINFIRVLTWIKIFLICFILGLTVLFAVYIPQSNFFGNFRRGWMQAAFGQNWQETTSYTLGQFTGTLIFPLIISILTLLFIRKRIFYGLVVILLINILMSLKGVLATCVAVILFLVFILNKKAKNYMKRIDLPKVE